MAGGEQQGEAAADAQADHPDLAGAAILAAQPAADGFHLLERSSAPAAQVAADRT